MDVAQFTHTKISGEYTAIKHLLRVSDNPFFDWLIRNHHLSIKFDPRSGLRVRINMTYVSVPCWIRVIPKHLKMQETCNEAVHIEPRSSAFVPEPSKAEEMCNEAVCRDAYTLDYIPDHFRMQERCNEAMCKNPVALFHVPDLFKTQEMCIKAVQVNPFQLDDVPGHNKKKKKL